MKTFRFWLVVPALVAGLAVGVASAKLPALDDAGKAKAKEAAAKKAEAAKKAAVALEKAQDRAVARYKKEKGGKVIPAATKKRK